MTRRYITKYKEHDIWLDDRTGKFYSPGLKQKKDTFLGIKEVIDCRKSLFIDKLKGQQIIIARWEKSLGWPPEIKYGELSGKILNDWEAEVLVSGRPYLLEPAERVYFTIDADGNTVTVDELNDLLDKSLKAKKEYFDRIQDLVPFYYQGV